MLIRGGCRGRRAGQGIALGRARELGRRQDKRHYGAMYRVELGFSSKSELSYCQDRDIRDQEVGHMIFDALYDRVFNTLV